MPWCRMSWDILQGGEEGQDEVSPAMAEMCPGQSLWKTKWKQLRELRTKLLDPGVGPAVRSTVYNTETRVTSCLSVTALSTEVGVYRRAAA